MDPNDPTRIQPAAEPPAERPGAWPQPPPSPYGGSGGYQPPTAIYPVASPPAPPDAPPQPYALRPTPPSGPSRGLIITGAVIALLLAGLIGFIVGVQVEKGRKPATVATGAAPSTTLTPSTTATSGTGGRPGAGTGGRTATGVVAAVSGNGFTITLANGSTVNVVVSGTTRIVKSVAGSLSDVTPGTRVVVVGPRGQNGDITASMVTVGLARAAGAGGRATTTTVP
jgi:hypothetical protein